MPPPFEDHEHLSTSDRPEKRAPGMKTSESLAMIYTWIDRVVVKSVSCGQF